MEKTLYWFNPIEPAETFQIKSVEINIASCYVEEAQSALEDGAVCVIDAEGNLSFTCYSLDRLARVQMPGDTIVYPSGRVLKVLA